MEETTDIGKSLDVTTDKRRELQELVPEAFTEGKLDVASLKRALGDQAIVESGELYALNWPGKAAAYKVLQSSTTATLRPQRDLSVNFDKAGHVFIEGENLEVLKVLQKSYFGKVKFIYIDPPYNTGSDSFIYPDRFQESKEDYLKRINELTDDGTLMREGFFRKNSKENGHYHSNWLSMMLPRIYIARNLLRNDGMIFVSCDDNEVHNLRLLMNEVFGEENFVAQNVWKKSYGGGGKSKHIVVLHEYVLCYARNKDSLGKLQLPPDPKVRKYYKCKDGRFAVRGPYRLQPLATTSMDERENLRFPILFKGEEIWPGKQWQWSPERVAAALQGDELVITKTDSGWSVNYKQYLNDEDGVERGAKPFSILEGPYTQAGTDEIKEIFGNGKVFSFPKPRNLIRYFLNLLHEDKDAIVLDFFAGSCSTAQALIEFNCENAAGHKLICVQLPEECDEGSEAVKAGFRTIADVGRARIRHSIERIRSESILAGIDMANLGFKSFLLSPSNFKEWRGDGIEDAAILADQIKMFVDSEKPGAKPENILYELLLKFGQPLTTPIENLEIEGAPIFAVNERQMLFVLKDFTMDMTEPLLALKPREIVALDSVFHDSDDLKSNLDLQCRDAEVQFICI